MRLIKNMRFNKYVIITLIFSYILSLLLFNDFKIINNFYYIRLIIPTIIIYICAWIGYKIIYLSSNYCTRHRKYYIVGAIILLTFLLIMFVYSIKFPSIQFDTWQIYDMSKYIFSDFGKMDMIRQHIYNTQYEIGFPPLYPFLMSTINYFFNFKVFSSVVINLFACLLLTYYIIKIGFYTKNYIVGLIISVLLMLNFEMLICYIGGSTLPLSMLFFVLTSYIVITKINNFNLKDIILLSIISGLGVLNRFDYLPIAFVIGVFSMFFNKKLCVKSFVIYFIILGLMLTPWIVYSKLHFDSMFITDNGRRLINIEDTRPSTFFSMNDPALTLFDNPLLWFKESFKRWTNATVSLYNFISIHTYIKELLIFFVILIGVGIVKIRKVSFHIIKMYICKNKSAYILSTAVILQTAAIILTGYSDIRYHILISFFIFYNVLCLLYNYFKTNYKVKNNIILFIIFIFIIILKINMYSIDEVSYMFSKLIFSKSNTVDSIILSENLDSYHYLKTVNKPRIIINRSELTMIVPKFAALCDEVTILSPSNIETSNAKDFVEFFDLNYLYSSNVEQVEIFKKVMKVDSTEVKYLYKLE